MNSPANQSSFPAAVLPITPAQLRAIMPHAPIADLQPLNNAMERYEINNGKRIAGFLAQLAVESNQLRTTEERYTLRKDFQLPGNDRDPYTATSKQDYFQHWYGERDDLGNTTKEDGDTFHGRGFIQVTGKYNYGVVGKKIDEPLAEHPELLADDANVDALASAYFFAVTRKLLSVADDVNPALDESIIRTNRLLTQGVNGHSNDIDKRLGYYRTALSVFFPGVL